MTDNKMYPSYRNEYNTQYFSNDKEKESFNPGEKFSYFERPNQESISIQRQTYFNNEFFDKNFDNNSNNFIDDELMFAKPSYQPILGLINILKFFHHFI